MLTRQNRDTLVRHLTIHGSKSCVSKAGIAARVNKACASCARLRVKCDGAFPCARCASRSLACGYAGKSSQRIATIAELKELHVRVGLAAGEGGVQGGGGEPSGRPSTGMMGDATMSSPERAVLDALYSLSNGAPPLAEPSEMDPMLAAACDGAAPQPFTPGFSTAETLWDPEPSSAMTLDFASSWDQDFSVLDWMTFDFGFGEMAVSPEMSDFMPVSESAMFPELDPVMQAYQAELTDLQNRASLAKSRHESHVPGNAETPPPPPPRLLRRSRTTTRAASPDAPETPPLTGDRELKKPHEWPNDWTPKKSDNIITFPDMSQISPDVLDVENFGHVEPLDARTYDEIHALLRRTSCGKIPGHSFPPFRTPHLPSREAFNCCVQLYFEYFHPIFPMLHKSTFRPAKAPWRLVLATAAIGCRYSRVPKLAQCANALQELLRRAVFDAVETDNSHARELWYSQVVILSHIGMTYSGNKRLLEIVEGYRNLSPTLCRRKWKEQKSGVGRSKWRYGRTVEERWLQWIDAETHTRVYLSSFVSSQLDGHDGVDALTLSRWPMRSIRYSLMEFRASPSRSSCNDSFLAMRRCGTPRAPRRGRRSGSSTKVSAGLAFFAPIARTCG
jgi:hypothetical protein